MLLLVSGSFDQLLTLAMFAIIAFSTLTVASVFVLRLRRPDSARPFRVPLYPLAPGALRRRQRLGPVERRAAGRSRGARGPGDRGHRSPRVRALSFHVARQLAVESPAMRSPNR